MCVFGNFLGFILLRILWISCICFVVSVMNFLKILDHYFLTKSSALLSLFSWDPNYSYAGFFHIIPYLLDAMLFFVTLFKLIEWFLKCYLQMQCLPLRLSRVTDEPGNTFFTSYHIFISSNSDDLDSVQSVLVCVDAVTKYRPSS